MTIITNLLTNEEFTVSVINLYCEWAEENTPLIKSINGTNYATTGSVINLLDNSKNSFISNRSNFRNFYVNLGAIRLEDNSPRGQFVNDPRLKVTWFHNGRSIAATLLSHQPCFNAFLGIIGDRVAAKYSLGWLVETFNLIKAKNKTTKYQQNKLVKLVA